MVAAQQQVHRLVADALRWLVAHGGREVQAASDGA